MVELKAVYESLGLVNISTYVQSGNVVFQSAGEDISALTGAIEAAIAEHFHFQAPVILRERESLRQTIAGNPFARQRHEDPAGLHVTFLSAAPASTDLPHLAAGTPDEYILAGREVYLFCPNGYGKTKLSNDFFERKLKVRATTRNWKTVLALQEMADRLPPEKGNSQ